MNGGSFDIFRAHVIPGVDAGSVKPTQVTSLEFYACTWTTPKRCASHEKYFENPANLLCLQQDMQMDANGQTSMKNWYQKQASKHVFEKLATGMAIATPNERLQTVADAHVTSSEDTSTNPQAPKLNPSPRIWKINGLKSSYSTHPTMNNRGPLR